MVGCSAYGCKSRSEKKVPGITFHRFPFKDSEKLDCWMHMIDFMPTENDKLCSNHFEKSCFYKIGEKTYLLDDAVPSIFKELRKYLQERPQPKRGSNKTMAAICRATGCFNKEHRDSEISFHSFPLHNKRLLRSWLTAMNRKNFSPSRRSKICSDHFKESDYLKSNGTNLKKLKPRAVPSVFKGFAVGSRPRKKQRSESQTSDAVEFLNVKTSPSDYEEEEQTSDTSNTVCVPSEHVSDEDDESMSISPKKLTSEQFSEVTAPICSVEGCPGDSPYETVDFFPFPKSKHLQKKWKTFTGNQTLDINKAFICSLHFAETDFVLEISETSSGCALLSTLAPGAVPTISLPKLIPPIEPDVSTSLMDPLEETVTESNKVDISDDVGKLIKLKAVNVFLEKQAEKLQKQLSEAEQYLEEQKKIVASVAVSKIDDGVFSKELLSKVFSDAQIKLLSGNKRTKWTDNDVAVALTIRYLSSRRFYHYLTETLKYPLPSISTLTPRRRKNSENEATLNKEENIES